MLYTDPSGLVTLGNCDINVYTGKTVCKGPSGTRCIFKPGSTIPESCEATFKHKKTACKIDNKGNIKCKGKRGPLECTIEYDSESGDIDWDYRLSNPELDSIKNSMKAKFEAAKLAAEVFADKIEAQAEHIADRQNERIEDALDGY